MLSHIKNNNHTIINNPSKKNSQSPYSVNVVLIGAGIMSATLGTFLTILEPNWTIQLYERLSKPAQESSNAWNNAGTGHAAFCELNYTIYDDIHDSFDISKAITINESFEVSCQFWAYLIRQQILNNPKTFINNIPHMSFVWGEKNILFLKKRFQALQNSILFHGMTYSEDPDQIYTWIPLIMKHRKKNQKVAATHMKIGTDINFGEITQQMLNKLKQNFNFKMYLQHEVIYIKNHSKNNWQIHILDLQKNQQKNIETNYVFVGAGGKSLNLLQTANIPEIEGYAGFPVGGQFLVTKNPEVVKHHTAKVYGKAPIHTPPMSVPHIDTRILNGNRMLLFGPFATFSSKFLKYGSWLDLFYSLTNKNLLPILQVGIDNLHLLKYLVNQLTMSNKDRINILKKYYPSANPTDWSLIHAGQRVQIIKKNNKQRGMLQFGTEIVSSNDGSLSALLGASPGASTVVSIILEVLNTMFKNKIKQTSWEIKLTEIIPSYKKKLNNNPQLLNQIRQNTYNTLKLKNIKIDASQFCSTQQKTK